MTWPFFSRDLLRDRYRSAVAVCVQNTSRPVSAAIPESSQREQASTLSNGGDRARLRHSPPRGTLSNASQALLACCQRRAAACGFTECDLTIPTFTH